MHNLRGVSAIVGLVLTLSLIGCGASAPMMPDSMESGSVERVVQEMEKPAANGSWAGDTDDSTAVGEVERMIIRNAELDLVVKDTEAAQEAVEGIVGEVEGYVLSAERYAYNENQTHVNMTLRVPAEQFNLVMSRLRDMALEVQRDSMSSQDVTEEYVDLRSRLKAQETKAARLEELMEEAEDTEAVLEVYRELSATHQEIERLKGRMNYLENAAALATIVVYLRPDEVAGPVEVSRWRPGGTLKSAVEALIETLKFLVDALIWIMIYIAPVLLVIGLVGFGIFQVLRRVFRFRRKSKKAKTPEPEVEEDTAEA